MAELIRRHDNEWTPNQHAIEIASGLHIELVKLQPFIDGNGRSARLLLNFELMKQGYPPIVIEREDRAEYYLALDRAHTTGDNVPFMELVVRMLNKTLDLYLKLV